MTDYSTHLLAARKALAAAEEAANEQLWGKMARTIDEAIREAYRMREWADARSREVKG